MFSTIVYRGGNKRKISKMYGKIRLCFEQKIPLSTFTESSHYFYNIPKASNAIKTLAWLITAHNPTILCNCWQRNFVYIHNNFIGIEMPYRSEWCHSSSNDVLYIKIFKVLQCVISNRMFTASRYRVTYYTPHHTHYKNDNIKEIL